MHDSTEYPHSVEEFMSYTDRLIADRDNYRESILYAVGGMVLTLGGTLASVRYPVVNGPNENRRASAILQKVLGLGKLGKLEGVVSAVLTSNIIGEVLKYFRCFEGDGKYHGNIEALKAALELAGSGHAIATFIFDDIPVVGVEDGTLKLYALSNRVFTPNSLDLSNIFGAFPNIAWDGDRPMDELEVEARLMQSAFGGRYFAPDAQDKFPFYLHRINAKKMGVRIVDYKKVRLGAYLGESTTVMPGASYVNFNAGTLGKAIVEGRISSSATVGDGTDVGGGASILGVLSGGNKTPIKVGRNCLLGANSTLGISLADAVVLSAGVAVMPKTPVSICFQHPTLTLYRRVKAIELCDVPAITLFPSREGGGLDAQRIDRNIEALRKLENGESILNEILHRN